MTITLRKGLDLPIAGEPEQTIGTAQAVSRVAVLGRDFVGLKPRMLVGRGDRVVIGQPLFVDKRDPAVQYTSPGTGTVSAVQRGNRRRLLSVIIELDGDDTTQETETAEDLRSLLCATGLWTSFRTRPYGKVPQSDSQPAAIFVTAIDTNPLSPNPASIVASNTDTFQAGLTAIKSLTAGRVHLCTAPDFPLELADEQVNHTAFSGPHPAGLPGTHIHHLEPVSATRTVWQIGYQDVIAIGRLVSDGVLDFSRVVALGGPGFSRPRLVQTRTGAAVDELCAGELILKGVAGGEPRLVSGSVLDGREASGAEAFIGRYHQQVCALPVGEARSWFGWLGSRHRGHTFAGLMRRHHPGGSVEFSTASKNRSTTIPIDAFERVMPLDILPMPLLRSLLIRDTDQAQALGCLELEPEDLALCSYVCPGKLDYGAVLRVNLEQIEREG